MANVNQILLKGPANSWNPAAQNQMAAFNQLSPDGFVFDQQPVAVPMANFNQQPVAAQMANPNHLPLSGFTYNHNLDAAEITNFHQLPINDFTFKDHLASTQPPNLLQPPNGGSRLNMNPATTEIPDEGPTEKELGKLKTPERLEEQRPRKKNKRAVEPVQANKDRSPLVALEQPCGQPDKGPKHQPSPTTSAAPQVSESTLGGTVDEGADVYGSNFLDPSCARICER